MQFYFVVVYILKILTSQFLILKCPKLMLYSCVLYSLHPHISKILNRMILSAIKTEEVPDEFSEIMQFYVVHWL